MTYAGWAATKASSSRMIFLAHPKLGELRARPDDLVEVQQRECVPRRQPLRKRALAGTGIAEDENSHASLNDPPSAQTDWSFAFLVRVVHGWRTR